MLISGAGGFVGRHLAVAMARNGYEVVALVRRTGPVVLDEQKGIRVEHADLAQTGKMPDGPFDAVLHCAAAIPSAVPDEAELFRINVEGSRRLFEQAVQAHADVIVFCSSMAVYGSIDKDVVDADTPIHNPSVYGRSKLECERLLAEFEPRTFRAARVVDPVARCRGSWIA